MKKNKLFYRILGHFGEFKKYEYTYDEFESISHFFKKTKGDKFYIDDTTWNDLDMDEIFVMIDKSNTSVGRDCLYRLLRMPEFDEGKLKERKRLIEFFGKNKDKRTFIQKALYRIGYNRKVSALDYLENLMKLKPEGGLFHIVPFIFVIASILYMIVYDPVIGILFLLLSLGVDIITYYKYKAKVENYFSSIRQLVAMLDSAKEICKMDFPEISEYTKILEKDYKKYASISRGSFLLSSSKDVSGSLADVFLEYVRILTHIDLMKFNGMLRKIDKNTETVYELYYVLGFLESMISVANFRTLVPYYCEPEFTDGKGYEIKNGYHLLIKEPVANSITENKSVLITGSNASGKSTFLKTVALSQILAQTVYTVPAELYKAPFYRTYTSMALRDDLNEGNSYFIVEIKSLKRIIDASKEEGATISCFIDEVLRGTNTVERISASSEILFNLSKANVMCNAATHDIELTELLGEEYSNYHFSEDVVDNEVKFNYLIKEGKATSRNAIKLLEMMGYDEAVVKKAQKMADKFVEKGIWEMEK